MYVCWTRWHICNAVTSETEARGLLLGQLGLPSETLPKKPRMNSLCHVWPTRPLKTSYSVRTLLTMLSDLLTSSVPDTVWSSRQSPWLRTVPWTTVRWPDGCSISGRDTQCVWTVSLQLWILWACVVPEMAWIPTGKEGQLTDGLSAARPESLSSAS